MEQLPSRPSPPSSSEIVGRAVERFGLPLETLLYDATNFFTFIAIDEHPRRAARAGPQQAEAPRPAAGRSRPALHARRAGSRSGTRCTAGQVPDAKSFSQRPDGGCAPAPGLRWATNLRLPHPRLRQRQRLAGQPGASSTASRAALRRLPSPPRARRPLVAEANAKMEPVSLDDRRARCLPFARAACSGASSERSSCCCPNGCAKGRREESSSTSASAQAVARPGSTKPWSAESSGAVNSRIQHDIEARLRGRQHLREVLQGRSARKPTVASRLAYTFDHHTLDTLDRDTLGRHRSHHRPPGLDNRRDHPRLPRPGCRRGRLRTPQGPRPHRPAAATPLDRSETPRPRPHLRPRLSPRPAAPPAGQTVYWLLAWHGTAARAARAGTTRDGGAPRRREAPPSHGHPARELPRRDTRCSFVPWASRSSWALVYTGACRQTWSRGPLGRSASAPGNSR